MRVRCLPGLGLAALLTNLACAGAPAPWSQLSLSTCKVDTFIENNPEADGRGVVIAVLDTGVDPSIPGLTRLSDGGVKVIDVQDFTGQGDLELTRVRLNETGTAVIHHDDDGVPLEYALPELSAASDEERLYWFTFFDEQDFINSDVSNLNDNGSTEDKFGVLVTALSGDGDDQALCYVDTNLDRSFADEQALKSYRLRYDTFTLARRQPEAQIEPVTFAVNIFLRQHKVVVHYDDGAHGTHVAGIAAGYRINNQDGFNGVAPGARLMSLKIGKNSVGGVSSTEAIKDALEYAARYARREGVPVVCNLSYGVESVLEGESDIDKFVDGLLEENPYLVFCTSAGNEGPGLSSVGTPAAAAHGIAVAAVLAADSGRDVQGYTMSEPVVTVFSSRGGELAKPDLAAPGWCTSTVPRWVRDGDYWAGTSMASPYAAGMCALIISDAQYRQGLGPVRACDVRRALCLAGKPVRGATAVDTGYGLPEVPQAAKLLAKFARAAQDDPVIAYDISTDSPLAPGGKGPTAYWRSTYFPAEERQTFTVKPVFAPLTDAAAKTAFVRKFELRSTVPWCKLPQETTYLRSEQDARIFVEYQADQLTEPGLYVGTVEALHEGEVAFRLLNTVIVPYRFNAENNFTRRFTDQRAEGWTPRRYFVAVPPGASAMQVTLSAPAGERSHASIQRIFGPQGEQSRERSCKLDTEAGQREVVWNVDEDLCPGVWELVVHADRADRTWPYELEVRFFGLHAEPARITEGDGIEGSLTVTNLFEEPFPGVTDGVLEGFRLTKEAEFKGLKDTLTYKVTLDERFRALRLDLEMTPKAYATTTDIGVAVEDEAGEAVYSSGFSWRTLEATVAKPDPEATVEWTVKIRAGFAVEDDKRKTPMTVHLDHLFGADMPLELTWDDTSNVTFVPSVPVELEYSLDGELPKAPEDTHPVGYLRVREQATNAGGLRVPIDIEE